MENIDFEKRAFNTRFLCRKFFDQRLDFPFDYTIIHQDEVEALKKSIEIIKSDEYSKRDFKMKIFSIHAPEFWKDLYWLQWYEEIKNNTEASFKKQQTDFNNNPDKDDIDFKYRFDQVKIFKQKNLEDIDNIINLVKEFRDLINKAMPELEDEFKRLLLEHNDFQVSEAEKDKARDEERKRLRNARKINIPRLQTNLTSDQRAQLFTELVEGAFISNNTAKDCFNWAIGVTNEKEPIQPGKWQPIEWIKNKQLCRELLEAIKSDEIIKAEMERLTPALFSLEGEPLKLAKARPRPDIDSDKIIEIVKNLATVLKN
jgi:hypothetical protein